MSKKSGGKSMRSCSFSVLAIVCCSRTIFSPKELDLKVQGLCVDENIGAQHSLIVKTAILIIFKQLIDKDSVRILIVKQSQIYTEREMYKYS